MFLYKIKIRFIFKFAMLGLALQVTNRRPKKAYNFIIKKRQHTSIDFIQK